MTIAEYQDLTGTVVSDADTPRITAIISRSEARLETLLGYSLSKQKKWTELGKVQLDGSIPFPSLPVNDDTLNNLSDPDDTSGDIQLFNFNTLDKHFRINPAKEVYRAKIVMPIDSNEFITIYELQYVTPYLNSVGLVTALTRSSTWFNWTWWNSLMFMDRSKLMLAVEAKYVNLCDAEKYSDIAYLLTDMVQYYSDPAFSLLGNIHSESIDTHTYARKPPLLSTPEDSAPESQASAKMIIEKYAGPAAFRKLVQ